MRFKPGQEVVCVLKRAWNCGTGPKADEIVTVDGEPFSGPLGGEYIYLVEYSQNYKGKRVDFNAEHFEPVVSISELESILREEPQHA